MRRQLTRTRWTARLLRIPLPKGETSEPGLILIQIDGLARKHFDDALKQGKLPFLDRLIHRKHFSLETFYPGMPSTTPAVQGEIFFGVKTAVPSFQFLNRDLGKVCRMYEADAAEDVEARLTAEGNEPLLKGGHSYSNIYVAGAAQSRYCARDFAPTEILKHLNPLKWLLLSALYCIKLLRIVLFAIVELVLAFIDAFRGYFEKEDLFKELKFIPARVAICCVVKELIRFRIMLDVERGVRLIHANFLGYDEQAHRRGPDSAFAFWTLKGIDRAIRDIYRAASLSDYRDYEIIVYSDHGQEHSTPYEKIHGRSIQSAIAQVFSQGPVAGHEVWMPKLPEILGSTLERCRNMLGRSTANASSKAVCDPATQIIVTALGPIGHIYLPVKLTAEEKAGYARELVAGVNVPLVMFPDAERVRCFNKSGEWWLDKHATEVVGTAHPFMAEVAEDLAVLCHHRESGDLLISGWNPSETPVSFAMENGAHGGPGFDETQGFILVPDRVARWHRAHLPESSKRVRGKDLYQITRHFLEKAGSKHEVARAPIPVEKETQLRVMTYNIHSCRGIDGKVRPERIARVINRFDPDIVAVQEVDVARPRTGTRDQAREIADHLGMSHAFYGVFAEAGEQYGIAIFSKFPFELVKKDHLTPAGPGRKEARGAMWVKFDRGEGTVPFHFINTHFGLGRDERRRQTDALLGKGWLEDIGDEPVIVCGDFNSRPSSGVWRRMHARLRDTQLSLAGHMPLPTFTSLRPWLRIDHIFASPHFQVEEVELPNTPVAVAASDHLPLGVVLNFQEP